MISRRLHLHGRLACMTSRFLVLLMVCGLALIGCGVSQTERWDVDFEYEKTPAGPEEVDIRAEDGELIVTISQEMHVKKTPVERLIIVFEETYSEIDWDEVGFTTFAILGGILIVAGSVAGGFYIGG